MPPGLRQILVLFGCNLIALWIVSQLDHYIAPLHIYVWTGGLLVTVATLRTGFREGLAVALLTGLAADALHPVPFGLHALLFGVAHCLLFRVRHRLPANQPTIEVLIALFLNLALFAALSLVELIAAPGSPADGPRLLGDLFFSQCALLLLAPWFFSLQTRTLALAGAMLPVDRPHRP